MGTQFLDVVSGRCTSKKLDNFTMFRFVALFACLAFAAAEPQWAYPQAVDAAHLKTPSGDTVSVQALKIQHQQLKADEYAKKGYLTYAYTNKMVAAPPSKAFYSAPATYAAATMPAYTNGIYSPYGLRHLYKREADSDSQVFYTNPYAGNQYVNNVYNTAGVYGGYAGLSGYTLPYSTYGKIQSAYGLHHLGKREADSDSQMVIPTAYGGYSQINNAMYNNIYKAGIYGAAYPAINTYKTGMYSGFPSTYYSGYAHSLGKRDADSDSQMFYTNPIAGSAYNTNIYNTAGVYGAGVYGANLVNAGMTQYTSPYNYGNIWNRAQYIY